MPSKNCQRNFLAFNRSNVRGESLESRAIEGPLSPNRIRASNSWKTRTARCFSIFVDRNTRSLRSRNIARYPDQSSSVRIGVEADSRGGGGRFKEDRIPALRRRGFNNSDRESLSLSLACFQAFWPNPISRLCSRARALAAHPREFRAWALAIAQSTARLSRLAISYSANPPPRPPSSRILRGSTKRADRSCFRLEFDRGYLPLLPFLETRLNG